MGLLRTQQRVQIDPAAAWGDQLNAARTPVRLHGVAELCEDVKRLGLLSGVEIDVEVAMGSSLTPDGRVHAQPPSSQYRMPAPLKAPSTDVTSPSEMAPRSDVVHDKSLLPATFPKPIGAAQSVVSSNLPLGVRRTVCWSASAYGALV